MASKRIRKKQETKKKRSLLSIELGISKKEARRLKGEKLNKVYKKEAQKRKNRERAREISAEAKRWGLSPSKFNSWNKLLPEIDREEGLRNHIRQTVHDRLGIPTGACDAPQIVDDKSQIELTNYYYADGWREVYSGKCKYWLPILKLIATMMTALYKPEDKLQFIFDLAAEVAYFDESYAEKILGIVS